jgi:methionyl aminopeptidase
MFEIGETSIKAKKLVKTTYESMMKAIKICKDGIHLSNIGATIQKHVESEGFSVVQDFCGHGIGETFHKEPNVLHYGKGGTGEKIKAGMIFTIEPMINLGNYETKTLKDGWTAVTKDKSLSAQFEHTIGITKDGYEIFTLSDKDKSN